MYDAFSQEYDYFVNWQSRLAHEMPFLVAQLERTGKKPAGEKRVFDTACGTGWHAIELSRRGYLTAGADISPQMVEKARANAIQAGVRVAFYRAGFGELAQTVVRTPAEGGSGAFDALLCLGNSLPHLLSNEALEHALSDFSACLEKGGLLLIQNRNFDALLLKQDRWMEPQSYRRRDEEWLFLRFYDYRADGLIDFNILKLQRAGDSPWKQEVIGTRLYPLRAQELLTALTKAGFREIETFGDMQGGAFCHDQSGNLVIVCRKE